MRICILSKHIPPRMTDGIARNRWQYAKMFKQMGWEVHVITEGVAGTEEYMDGIYIHEVEAEVNQKLQETVFSKTMLSRELKHALAYSSAVYERIKKLCQFSHIDLIDQSLWGVEGLITKIKLPDIPMLTRVDTTSRLIHEINYPENENEFTALHEIEQFLLNKSDSLVFNSWSILRETERLYKMSFTGKPYTVIHHGIDVEHDALDIQAKGEGDVFKVLLPGRLEKRKGTQLFIESVLPTLLAQEKNIEFHFVGRDNSEWDGFKNESGFTYPEYVQKFFPKEINKRIFFHGHVSEDALIEHYTLADCVLAPSLYESLGLVYLEALKYGKPLVAFNTGALPELLDDEKEALLVPLSKPLEICNAIKKLRQNPALRKSLVAAGKQKLQSDFTADQMIKKCMLFIESTLSNKEYATVYQVMNTLTVGDGVSTFARDYDYLFKENGQATQIIGNGSSPELSELTKQIHEFAFGRNDSIFYHYCGCCEWGEYINGINSPSKVLFFHNITPPHFFNEGTSEYSSVVNGLRQAPILDNFDLYVGFSQYSLNVLQQLIPKKLNTFIMPTLIDRQLILDRDFTQELVTELRQKHSFHILFVGRVWPHKKQMDIIKFAQVYRNTYNEDFHISIVGGGLASYVAELKALIKKYKLESHFTISGKVSDADLYAYYRSADVYLSMSEHEGFGMPLVEAMVFDVPVVAYGVTAIPETVGDNGCIFYEKNYPKVAEIIYKQYADKVFRNTVIEKQAIQLKKYSKESVWNAMQKLRVICEELHSSRLNSMMIKGKLLDEEFYNYKSPQILKRGEWKIADHRTLLHYGNEYNSALEIDLEFSELEIYMINNEKSGKADVYINNKAVLHLDLYHPYWTVKKYVVSNPYGNSVQNVKIVPACDNNPFSAYKEVLFYMFKASKSYRAKNDSVYTNSISISEEKSSLDRATKNK